MSCPDGYALSLQHCSRLPASSLDQSSWLQHRTVSPLPCWGSPCEHSASAPALCFLALSAHHELRSWYLSRLENSLAQGSGAETCSRSGGEKGLLETVQAGHARPRGEATQGWHPVLTHLTGFPWQQQGTAFPRAPCLLCPPRRMVQPDSSGQRLGMSCFREGGSQGHRH